MTRLTRTLKFALGLALLISLGCPTAWAQGDGTFLCSKGSRDGLSCESDDNCPGGVCVLSQGVCDGGTDNGFACSCPGGTCTGTPLCTADTSFGTCSGGPFGGECCDRDFNCAGGRPCVGSQKICVGGTSQGLPCLRAEHCPGGACQSTGRFCLGTCQAGSSSGDVCASSDDCAGAECSSDFQDASCGQDADCCTPGSSCPQGICEGAAAAPTATPTRTRTQGTTTPTRTRTQGTTTPGGTRTPTASAGVTVSTPGTSTPTPPQTTSTATPTPPTVPTSTGRPAPGTSVVAQGTAAGATTLTVVDATSFPVRGMLEIVADPNDPQSVMRVGYSRANLGNVLYLDAPLDRSVPSGAAVRSERAPAVVYENTGNGSGCMIAGGQSRDSSWFWLSMLGAAAMVLRRRRH